jgi:short-subunit dehydrogenase
VIVNNAGYGLFGAAEELSDQQILEQNNTNLVGRSRSSAPRCRTCASRAAAESSSCRPTGWPATVRSI